MAQDFQERIEAAAGIEYHVSSGPTQDDFTYFLNEGIIDVTNRMISAKPEEAHYFTTTSSDDSNSGVTVTGDIFSVVREHDSATTLRPCVKIPSNLRFEASDKTSLKYMSKYNPGYYVLDSKVFSVPASASSNNSVVVSQVSYPETNYQASSIPTFPKKYERLVVIYAAMKSLSKRVGYYVGEDLNITTATTNLGSYITSFNTAIGNATSEITDFKTALDEAKIELAGVSNLDKAKSALESAQKLFSDDAGFNALSNITDDLSNSTSVTGWLEEEDPEMVTATINAITEELKRAELEMSVFQTEIGHSKLHLDFANAHGLAIDQTIKQALQYSQLTQAAVSKAQLHIADSKFKFESTISQYQVLKNEYDMAFLTEAQISERKRRQVQASRNRRQPRRRQ